MGTDDKKSVREYWAAHASRRKLVSDFLTLRKFALPVSQLVLGYEEEHWVRALLFPSLPRVVG